MVWRPSSARRSGKDVQLTTVIEREGDGYVALCPQLDIASQGDTVALARENLKEALELLFRDSGWRGSLTTASTEKHVWRKWRSSVAGQIVLDCPRGSQPKHCPMLSEHERKG